MCVFHWSMSCHSCLCSLPPVLLPVCPVPVGGDVKVEVEYLYSANASLAAARLTCRIIRGTFPHISWVFNNSDVLSDPLVDSPMQPLLSHFAVIDRRQSLILTKLTPEQSGYYHCRARDSYDDSGPWMESTAVLVTGEYVDKDWARSKYQYYY